MNRDQIVLAHRGFARLEAIAAAAVMGLRALAGALASLRRAWMTARVRRELHELPERTLNDIGLTRSQIDALFR